MWRSKKFIIITVTVVAVVVGCLAGVVFANPENEDASQPEARFGTLLDKVCDIYNANADPDIDCDALKAAFDEARSEMQVEHPESRSPYGPMAQVFESFGVGQEAVQAAFDEAHTELEDGTLEGGRGAVMARVLEILGIDEQDWQAACDEVRQAHQEMRGEKPDGGPFGPGFGFRGMGRARGWGGQ